MTVTKTLAGLALAAALLVPQAHGGTVGQSWLPRATPSDYAAAAGSLPRALPADYARAGVQLVRAVGLPRAMPADYGRYFVAAPVAPREGFGFDWIAALLGAAGTLGLLLAAVAGTALLRRESRLKTA